MSSPDAARNRTRSQALQQRAERFFPGGGNSPVRAFRAVGGAPPFVERAEGAWLTDADGNRYIDYFGSWLPTYSRKSRSLADRLNCALAATRLTRARRSSMVG